MAKQALEKKTIGIEDLRILHSQFKKEIQKRLEDFSRIEPSEYFYEFAYCLLTPQTSAVNAGKAIEVLKAKKFHKQDVSLETVLHSKDYYIRFHNTKAKHLEKFKVDFPLIRSQLLSGETPYEIRQFLVKRVLGMGYKEASHFLRNIGKRDLAILDRHILKNLVRCGVLRSLPTTLSRKTYLAIEKKFQKFS